jgi:hypothetical protein
MVNTFLTVNDDPVASATSLDRQRLGKQRVEAYQILNNLDDLRFLANYLGIEPFPVNVNYPKHIRETWIKNVMTTVKSQLKAKYIHVDNSSHENGYVIGMGFKTHPCVTMWLGFETGLCYYINAHINEWISRGYKNNMATYPEAEAIFPSWCNNSDVTDAFRANLLAKEIERFEPLHYMYQEEFVASYANDDELMDYIYGIFRDYPQLQDEWHHKTELAQDAQDYLLSCRTHVKPYLWA